MTHIPAATGPKAARRSAVRLARILMPPSRRSPEPPWRGLPEPPWHGLAAAAPVCV
ncbi:hypothetical protein [Streptomyces sp. NPDC003077]|uniref:hypothetical protein n=1 Tax=Streptomyces sp. NPDC003077 TaxID=3154443 RepID=UPI0033A36BFC